MKKFLFVFYCVCQIAFVIMAFGANWARIFWTPDGGHRLYLALEPGTPLYAQPYEGAPFAFTTGPVLVESRQEIHPGGGYTNPEGGWVDMTSRFKVCLRIAVNPVDELTFATVFGCAWVRDPNGMTFTLLAGREVKSKWEEMDALRKKNLLSFATVAIGDEIYISGLTMVATFSPTLLAIFIASRRGRRRMSFAHAT